MAQDSSTKEEEAKEVAQLTLAVRAIERDPNLRFLFRQILTHCHILPLSSVFDVNPVQSAYNQGVQDVGITISNMLTSVAPLLIATLSIEDEKDEVE